MLAVLGVGHVVRASDDDVESVGLLVDHELPGVANGILAPSSGTCWFHGEVEVRLRDLPPTDVIVPIGVASPAVVPQQPAGVRDARRA